MDGFDVLAFLMPLLDIDVAVVALGAVRNVEWLHGAKLAADARGVACDASCV
jgi:3-phenylpropionate/trans-cinnamate dioxygenase ferredoxin reductase component